MPGLFGVFSETAGSQCPKALMGPLDRFGLCDTKCMRNGDAALIGVSWLRSAPIRESRCFENQEWMIAVSGDVVSIGGRRAGQSLPWDDIVSALADRGYGYFSSWRGMFCICAYNIRLQRTYLVSDRKAQLPIFYTQNNDGFFATTEMSWFFDFPWVQTRISTNWLYDHLFFNFGLFGTTFLENVSSILPASVVEYDRNTGRLNTTRYADNYSSQAPVLSGRRAHRRALEVFAERVPMYYSGAETINCSLTSGWDARTILAFRPDGTKVETYTYGVPGCEDLTEAQRTSSLLGLTHRSVEFDGQFLGRLRSYLFYTVYLSSGQQSISRSTLTHVYDTVTSCGTRLPVTLSGVAGDLLFRGHRCVPTPVSFDLDRAFARGRTDGNREFWRVFMGGRHGEFADHVEDRLSGLRKVYGPPERTEHHLLYLIYEAACKYYGGEYALAGNFTTFRTPFMDDDIIDLAFSVAEGTLGFSGFTTGKGKYKEWILEAFLISKTDPDLARIPVRGVPPRMAQYGYLAKVPYTVVNRVPMKLRGEWHAVPLEDWKGWLDNELKAAIDELIYSKEARIRQYVNPDALSLVPPKERRHYTMWLATVEVILRLMESGWALPEKVRHEIAEYRSRLS